MGSVDVAPVEPRRTPGSLLAGAVRRDVHEQSRSVHRQRRAEGHRPERRRGVAGEPELDPQRLRDRVRRAAGAGRTTRGPLRDEADVPVRPRHVLAGEPRVRAQQRVVADRRAAGRTGDRCGGARADEPRADPDRDPGGAPAIVDPDLGRQRLAGRGRRTRARRSADAPLVALDLRHQRPDRRGRARRRCLPRAEHQARRRENCARPPRRPGPDRRDRRADTRPRQGPAWGWASASTLGSFAISAAAIVAFVARSMRHHAPVVDLRLFRSREFSWANIAMLLLSVAFGIQLLGLVLWLQEGWGWSPLQTGLAIVPGPAMVSVTAIGLRRYTKIASGRPRRRGRHAAARPRRRPHRRHAHRQAQLRGRDPSRLDDHRRRRRLRHPHDCQRRHLRPRPPPDLDRQRDRPDEPPDRLRPRSRHAHRHPRPRAASASNITRFTDAWWWAGGFALAGALAARPITPLAYRTAAQPATATNSAAALAFAQTRAPERGSPVRRYPTK